MFEYISFFERVEDLHVKLDSGRYLFFVAENTDITPLSTLKEIVFTGAIFPRLLFQNTIHDQGVIVAKMSDATSYQIIPMDELNQLHVDNEMNSILAIIDGYSTLTEHFLELLYALLPEQSKLVGAGAGKTKMDVPEPVLFDHEKLYTNYAIVLSSKQTIGLGVKHGWKPVMGPFIATHSDGNILQKINFKDAYQVYQTTVERVSAFRFNSTPFMTIAQRFPLGIVRYNKDFILREPISTDGSNLVLVAKIDPNSVLSILEATNDDLIQAAGDAAANAYYEHPLCSSVLVIDCISRFYFLENAYPDELHAIRNVYPNDVILWGVLSLGEIANANQEGIEFYNNTCVVGTL